MARRILGFEQMEQRVVLEANPLVVGAGGFAPKLDKMQSALVTGWVPGTEDGDDGFAARSGSQEPGPVDGVFARMNDGRLNPTPHQTRVDAVDFLAWQRGHA